jgi:hypothetical protein
MIKDLDAYRKLSVEEEWQALRSMTIEESIALGEALLTSELMDIAEFPDDDHPLSLAKSLGIKTPVGEMHLKPSRSADKPRE